MMEPSSLVLLSDPFPPSLEGPFIHSKLRDSHSPSIKVSVVRQGFGADWKCQVINHELH